MLSRQSKTLNRSRQKEGCSNKGRKTESQANKTIQNKRRPLLLKDRTTESDMKELAEHRQMAEIKFFY